VFAVRCSHKSVLSWHSACVWESRETRPVEQGWWLASDGRWYPPEAAPSAYQRPSTSRRWGTRRVLILVIGAVVVLIAAVVSVGIMSAHRQEQREDALRHTAKRFTAPTRWNLVARTEEPGSPLLCVVSCPHVAVTLLFRTNDATRADACATIRAE